MRSEGMAFGVSQDISSAFGKGLNGLKVEAAMAKGGGLSVLDSVLLGAATIILAAIPVILTRFPAPESLIIAMELLQDWCTPSVCFVVLIVGVLIATSGVWGSLTSPEQNHKTFTEAYLSPSGPVSVDPLHMPDIFFSAETARANALSQSPVRVSAQPSSVIVPVYYPALIPSKDVDQPEAYSFNSDRSEWFGGAPDRFKESFSPQRFLDDSLLKDEDRARFMNLQAEERYVPQAEERYVPQAEERYVPQVEERYVPQVEERYVPQVEERYVPQSEERYVPLVEERYVPQVQDMYPEQEERYAAQLQESYPQVEERYEAHEQDLHEERYGSNYDAPHAESITIGHDAEDRGYRSESEDEEYRYEPTAEDNQAQEREYVQSEAEPRQVELLSDTEEQYHAHESSEEEDDEQLLPEPMSPPRAPDSPPATTAVEKAPTPKPPTPVTVEKAPSAKPPTPVAVEKALPPKPPAVPVEKAPPAGESPKVTLSPRRPPRHVSSRRPLSSSSSRSYAEFVRRTSTFSSKIPPSSVTTQSSKPEKTTSSSSSGSSVMSKQVSMPARKPREVMVVDDDKLEVQDEATPDADELDQRVEAFLKNFREQMRLQRQESLQRHRSRSLVDP